MGSDLCRACHRVEAEEWDASHHARAWNPPTEAAVLGDFDDAVFGHKGTVNRFDSAGGRYRLTTEGPDGHSQTFDIVGAVGVAPLQQYLVETAPGRLQAPDIAWDVAAERWYHLYPDQDAPHTDGLHWTGPYKNWNARCAECHATGYEKRYEAETARYDSLQAEKGVGCEACHGPGSAHLAWASDGAAFTPADWPGLDEVGLTISFSQAGPKTEIQQCAGCHARRESFTGDSPEAGAPFHDSYRLALLRDDLYHADGQIKDEVYVYGSFLQSKMARRGVRCSDCHNPHSGALKAEGDGVCTQCHNPAGARDFPTLKKADYETPAHHFHGPGSDGAACRNCHMIERVYMGIDGRRDHSFRIPRPDLSVTLGTPNACNDCHDDKTSEWAAETVAEWYPDGDGRVPHYATPFTEARRGSRDLAVATDLLGIALSDAQPGIVRATALEFLLGFATPTLADETTPLLRAPDPLVRAAAIALQNAAAPRPRIERVAPLLADPIRLVRIEAAKSFLASINQPIPRLLAGPVTRAVEDYRASLAANADFPESQMALAGLALTLRDFDGAEAAFLKAARMDGQRIEAWVMAARIRAARGDRPGAAETLERALTLNPTDPALSLQLRDMRGADVR